MDREQVKQKARENIIPLEDGEYYYWTEKGALSSFDLRVIADDLDELNRGWREQVENNFNGGDPKWQQ